MACESNVSFSWRAHPARQRLGGAAATGGLILLFAAAVYISFGTAWSLGSIVLLVASLNRFFFPSRFFIDREGITAHYPLRRQRLPWRDLRRFVHDRYGGYLSIRARRSRLDAYTGMHLIFGPQRQIIIEEVQGRLVNGQVNGEREGPA